MLLTLAWLRPSVAARSTTAPEYEPGQRYTHSQPTGEAAATA